MSYRYEEPSEGGGPVMAAVAFSLLVGLVWQLILIQDEWRLGFRAPVWEIVVGWLGFSAFAAFMMMVAALAFGAFQATGVAARSPESWDARQSVSRTKRRVAAFIVGTGGVAAFGGILMWLSGRMGPEFEAYAGWARFTAFVGVVAVALTIFYLRRGMDALQ